MKVILKYAKIFLFIIPIMILFVGCGKKQPTVLHVAIPYTDNIEDIKTNYYVNWLEEKTGLSLDISFFYNSRCDEYLSTLFSSDSDIDIVMFGKQFPADEELINKYTESGKIYKPSDGNVYTTYGRKEMDGAGEILWINYEWLEAMDLPIPRNTEELRTVLEAFKHGDINGNGEEDEIALIGCMDDYVYNPIEFLLGSFVYNDPYHSRYGIGAEADILMAAEDEFRAGLLYCYELCRDGLIDERTMTYNIRMVSELINSPEAIVGAFTTDSLSSVIYPGNPEIMARYVQVPPLKGPDGKAYAMYTLRTPHTAAIITGKSKNKEAAELLLDTMMTEEASLIARFGEPEVDWVYSSGQDVSLYGVPSTIVTNNYIWNTLQNKHLDGIGPMDVPKKYMEGVTWNGINSDAEFIDARAQITYKDYFPKYDLDNCRFHEYDAKLSEYMDKNILAFVTGKKNVRSNAAWKEFLGGMQ